MKNQFLLTVLVLLLSVSLSAQDPGCFGAETFEVIHGNNIRTMISSGGDLFWDLQDGNFLVPFNGPKTPTTVFAAAPWIGGLGDNGELRLSALTYRSLNRDDTEFSPGPLNAQGGTDSSTCEQWDRVWTVYKRDILIHLRDFDADGIIDDPVNSIYSWPGKGNEYFEQYNGFPRPDLPGLSAPFNDINNNGLYEPDLGEYPLPEGVDPLVIPNQVSWCVFNDNGSSMRLSGGIPLQVDIQLTSYALLCSGSSLLNNVVFNSFKVTNRSGTKLDSVYFGLWMDADLGCYSDDFVGCYPEGNLFFAYNQDSLDGTTGIDCPDVSGRIYTYQNHPPVSASKFLNRSLSSYIYYTSGFIGDWPDNFIQPEEPAHFYNLLKGLWRDGTPLAYGGLGLDTTPPIDTTSFYFPGDPRDTTSWSLMNIPLIPADRRSVASVYLGTIHPDESVTIDMAQSFHRDTALDHLGNVGLMYAQTDTLQEMYDKRFLDHCQIVTEICEYDCVYPGDVNHDGIVDGLDYLILATNLGETGPPRAGPLTWQPHLAEAWDQETIYGVNLKHNDCNGDGVLDMSDFDIVEMNFGLTHSGYVGYVGSIRYGDDFDIKFRDTLELSGSSFYNFLEHFFTPESVNEFHGFMYTLEIDTSYFRNLFSLKGYELVFSSGIAGYTTGTPDGMDFLMTYVDGKDRSEFKYKLGRDWFPWVWGVSITGASDTAYFSITNARAVKADGTIIPLLGALKEVIIVDELIPPRSSSEPHLELYPNPTTGQIYIDSDAQFKGESFRVFNSDGHLVQSGVLRSNTFRIDLPQGMYFVHLQLAGEVLVRRIAVIR